MTGIHFRAMAVAVAACIAYPDGYRARGQEEASPGTGRYAVFFHDVLGVPKWDNNQRVHGFMLTVPVTAPPEVRFFDFCLYVQYRRGDDPWRVVPATPDDRGRFYAVARTGTAYHFIRVWERRANLTFFIPHSVLHLREGRVELSFVLRLFKNGTEVVPDLDRAIPLPGRVLVEANRSGRTIRRLGKPVHGWEIPAVLYDFEEGTVHPITPFSVVYAPTRGNR